MTDANVLFFMRCNFCGKPVRDVRYLVAAEDHTCICDECVRSCQVIVDEAIARKQGGAPAPSSPPEPTGMPDPWPEDDAVTRRARTAVTEWRDWARAHGMPTKQRDELVWLIHQALDHQTRGLQTTLQEFIGFLSGDVPELHHVEIPTLAKSVERFLAVKDAADTEGR